MKLLEKLINIQKELKAPKNQRNDFGKYNFRSCEDILEAVKPICYKYKTALILSDEIIVKGESVPTQYGESFYDKEIKGLNTRNIVVGNQRYYVESTATLYDVESEEKIFNKASAREEEMKKGMDGSQITGTASSYARKYALNGLFDIDDTKDADTNEFTKQNKKNEQPSPYDFQNEEMTEEQTSIIANLEPKLKERLREVYKKDPLSLTKLEADNAIESLKKNGLIKTKEQKEKDKKNKEEVF